MNMRYYLLLLVGAMNLGVIQATWRDITFRNETDMDLAAQNSKVPKRGEVYFAVEPGTEINIRDPQGRVQSTWVTASGSYKFKIRKGGSNYNPILIVEQY